MLIYRGIYTCSLGSDNDSRSTTFLMLEIPWNNCCERGLCKSGTNHVHCGDALDDFVLLK